MTRRLMAIAMTVMKHDRKTEGDAMTVVMET